VGENSTINNTAAGLYFSLTACATLATASIKSQGHKMNTIFFAVPIGSYFECNGNLCIKQSPRTARLVRYNKVFYFGGTERVQLKGQP
jgi:hypothetical protein